MASHYIKSPMGHDVHVCIEDQPYGDRHDVCTSYGTLQHMYLSAVKGGSTENQSYGNSTCTQKNTVSFTQCVHVHNSVTERHCEGMFTY